MRLYCVNVSAPNEAVTWINSLSGLTFQPVRRLQRLADPPLTRSDVANAVVSGRDMTLSRHSTLSIWTYSRYRPTSDQPMRLRSWLRHLRCHKCCSSSGRDIAKSRSRSTFSRLWECIQSCTYRMRRYGEPYNSTMFPKSLLMLHTCTKSRMQAKLVILGPILSFRNRWVSSQLAHNI